LKLWLHRQLTAIGDHWVLGYAEASGGLDHPFIRLGR
jgi:hypothetical protein